MPLKTSDLKSINWWYYPDRELTPFQQILEPVNENLGKIIKIVFLKCEYNKEKLITLTLDFIDTREERDPELLDKMVSYLGPELRILEKENEALAEKVKAIVQRVWPELYDVIEKITSCTSMEENVNIIRSLHDKRAFYLLEKMRVKLGAKSFNNLLLKASTFDIEFLTLLAYVREDQLLKCYLECWADKYPNLIEKLNDKKFLKTLVNKHCVLGVQTFSQIIKRLKDPGRIDSIMQALKLTGYGETLLYSAVRSGNVELVKAVTGLYLTDAMKMRAFTREIDSKRLLDVAAEWGKTEVFRVLTSLCTTDAIKTLALMPCDSGFTSLHLLVRLGNIEGVKIVKSLCTTDSLKEQVLMPNVYGVTPLEIAAKSGNVDLEYVVGSIYTASLLLVENIKEKPHLASLNLETLKQLLVFWPNSSQEHVLIESEIHLRLGEKKELCDKWKGWLYDLEECKMQLLSQILLRHPDMAKILLKYLKKEIEETAKRLTI